VTYTKLAIIGTAGRGEDQNKLVGDSYQRMVEASIKLMTHLSIDPRELSLFSGGAAWADHIVVSLAMIGVIPYERVCLYLPVDLSEEGYVGVEEWSNKVARTANYYHAKFFEVSGCNGIRELHKLKLLGGILDSSKKGFKARNTSVANSVSDNGILLAYTFGNGLTDQLPWTIRSFSPETKADGAGLKDGGTSDTWNKAKCPKFHCLLGN
jgi:hypothetical protein